MKQFSERRPSNRSYVAPKRVNSTYRTLRTQSTHDELKRQQKAAWTKAQRKAQVVKEGSRLNMQIRMKWKKLARRRRMPSSCRSSRGSISKQRPSQNNRLWTHPWAQSDKKLVMLTRHNKMARKRQDRQVLTKQQIRTGRTSRHQKQR